MKQSVTVGAQLLWGGRYGCNNGRYGCTIVMSYIEINKAVLQWLLTFNLCVSVTWPLTCAFHIACTHTPEIIDMHRGVCDNKCKHLPRNWSPVKSLHKGQWRGAFMFSLICFWINGWVNNREAGDLRGYRTHYDVTIMRYRHPPPRTNIASTYHVITQAR